MSATRRAVIPILTGFLTGHVMLALPTASWAASWNVSDGNWTNAANWNPTVLPTNADNAIINNAGTATVDSAVSVGKMENAGVGFNSTLKVVTGGTLTTTTAGGQNGALEVGRSVSDGTLIVDGGTVNCEGTFFNGHYSSSTAFIT